MAMEALPDVTKLVIFMNPYQQPSLDKRLIWDLCFSGSTFPNLKEIELDTMHASSIERPLTMNAAAKVHLASFWVYHASAVSNAGSTPFHGLESMSSIKLEFNDALDVKVLKSLFGSSVVPQHLTTLDISYCPSLSFVRDLSALSMLLQRSLRFLKHLRLHLCKLGPGEDWNESTHTYTSKITGHPDLHLCNVVREVGQNVKMLDLALPYACSRMFSPNFEERPTLAGEADYPNIPWEPYETLPNRLLSAGYKYRRLICWNGPCRKTEDWKDIMSLASNQGSMTSWEIVNAHNKRASWHVGGSSPQTYRSRDVVRRAYTGGRSL